MNPTRRRVWSGAGVVLVFAMVLLFSLLLLLPAQALGSAPMSVTMHCETGASHFLCDAFPSGGVSPYTYRWFNTTTQSSSFYGGCVANTWVSVPLTVTDSQSSQVSTLRGFRCSANDWP